VNERAAADFKRFYRTQERLGQRPHKIAADRHVPFGRVSFAVNCPTRYLKSGSAVRAFKQNDWSGKISQIRRKRTDQFITQRMGRYRVQVFFVNPVLKPMGQNAQRLSRQLAVKIVKDCQFVAIGGKERFDKVQNLLGQTNLFLVDHESRDKTHFL
jgi:hypothetical protein